MKFVRAATAVRPLLAALVLTGLTGFSGTAMAQGAAQAAGGAQLASHEARYEMRLATVRSAAGIVGAAGTMDYAFTQGCEGWTVETRTELTLAQTQGGAVHSSWEFVSWESHDGTSYRFRVRNTRNGSILEAYDGEASMTPEEGGQAVFRLSDGEDKTFDLAPGTMFPTAHTLALIDKARDSTRFFAAPVFDGSAVQAAFQVSAAIGAPLTRPSTAEVEARHLLDTASWPVTLAFFSEPEPGASDVGDLPDFEVSLRYHENSVAEDLLQDFGTFSLRARLLSLKETERQGC